MDFPPFHGPRHKIERARKHILEIEGMLDACNPPNVGLHRIGETEDRAFWVYDIYLENAPPPEISLALGDAIHNLRAALDILVCDVSRLRNFSATDVKFPFAPDEETLQRYVNEKPIRRVGADLQKALLDLAPYKGGNVLLRGLHDLDIADKHKLILPVYIAAFVDLGGAIGVPTAQRMSDLEFGSFMVMPLCHGGQMTHNKEYGEWPSITPLADGVQANFGADTPLAGSPIIDTLHKMADLVATTINDFEAKFTTNGSAGGQV